MWTDRLEALNDKEVMVLGFCVVFGIAALAALWEVEGPGAGGLAMIVGVCAEALGRLRERTYQRQKQGKNSWRQGGPLA